MILGDQYDSYQNALKKVSLEDLESRRDKLCTKFAKKSDKHEKHKNWFKPKPNIYTRQKQDKYCKIVARTGRLKKSPISYMTDLLNNEVKK